MRTYKYHDTGWDGGGQGACECTCLKSFTSCSGHGLEKGDRLFKESASPGAQALGVAWVFCRRRRCGRGGGRTKKHASIAQLLRGRLSCLLHYTATSACYTVVHCLCVVQEHPKYGITGCEERRMADIVRLRSTGVSLGGCQRMDDWRMKGSSFISCSVSTFLQRAVLHVFPQVLTRGAQRCKFLGSKVDVQKVDGRAPCGQTQKAARTHARFTSLTTQT